MIDPIHCRISGSAAIHIFYRRLVSGPTASGSLAFRIAPPFSRFFSGLTHTKSMLYLTTLKNRRERECHWKADTGLMFLQRRLLHCSCNDDFCQ